MKLIRGEITMNYFEELLFDGKPTKSDIKKVNRRYFIMVVVISLGMYLLDKIWPFKEGGLIWYDCILGGFLITTGLWGIYVFIYKGFLRSRHKFLFIFGFIAFVLFKLLPYILGWKKF
jgi:hypothetical protein